MSSKTGHPSSEQQENVAVEALRGGRGGFRTGLSELFGTLYDAPEDGGAGVQHLIYRNTRHYYYSEYYGALKSDDVIETLAERHVMDVFLELGKDRQGMVNVFQNVAGSEAGLNKNDYKSFAMHLYEGNDPTSTDDDRVHSRDRKGALEEKRATGTVSAQSLPFYTKYIAPLLDRTARSGIRVHLTDNGEEQSLRQIFKDACEGQSGTDVSSECNEARRNFYLARFDDREEAGFIADKAGDGRSIVCVGAGHGSRENDFEEFLERYAGKDDRRVITIDVAPNFEIYEAYGQKLLTEKMRQALPELGDDPPDLVYLTEEKMCLTTKNTPDYVLDALIKKGIEFTLIDKLYAQSDATGIENENDPMLLAEGIVPLTGFDSTA